MSNKKLALFFACCAAAGISASCNEAVEYKPFECSDGAKACQNNTIISCVDGVWATTLKCEGATPFCDSTTYTCSATQTTCSEGEKICDNNTLKTCIGGTWSETPCGTQFCNSVTKACEDAPNTCTPGCSNGVSITCSGNIPTTTVCPNGCKPDGSACNEASVCIEQCVNGIMTKCESGISKTETCEYGCNAEGTGCADNAGNCIENETRCVEEMLQTCTNGDWDSGISCNQDEICGTDEVTGLDACIPAPPAEITHCAPYNNVVLSNGESQCFQNELVTCTIEDGAVSEPNAAVKNCADTDDYICSVNAEAAECIENLNTDCENAGLAHGESACDDETHNIITCNDGQINETTCDQDKPCTAVNSSFICYEKSSADCTVVDYGIITDGTGACVDNTYKFCSGGTITDTVCSDAAPICDETVEGFCRDYKKCTIDETIYNNGDTFCSEDKTGIDICVDGEIKSQTTCTAPQVCDSQSTACIDPTVKYTTIKQIRDAFIALNDVTAKLENFEAEFTGVITANQKDSKTNEPNKKGVAIQDSNAAVFLYNSQADLNLSVGSEVTVKASTSTTFNGLLEITDVTATTKDNTLTPITPLSDKKISAYTENNALNPYQNMLVTLKDVKVTALDSKNATITDDSGSIGITYQFDRGIIAKLSTDFIYDVTGIIYNTVNKDKVTNYIGPRGTEDIAAKGCVNPNAEFTAADGDTPAKCVLPTPSCTSNICADDKIQICNTETGILADAVACSGSDANGIYGCADETSCGLKSCKDNYYQEDNACIAKCTANVCKDGKLQTCSENGKLSVAAACTGTDAHGIYSCTSETACGLTDCTTGWQLNSGKTACVEIVEDNCSSDADCKDSVTHKHGKCVGTPKDCDYSTFTCDTGYHKEDSSCVKDCTAAENNCADTTSGSTVTTCNTTTKKLENKVSANSCAGKAEGVCFNGTTKCDSSGQSTCASGAWGTATACPNGCNNTGTACKAESEILCDSTYHVGTQRCDSTGYKICTNVSGVGTWSAVSACSFGCEQTTETNVTCHTSAWCSGTDTTHCGELNTATTHATAWECSSNTCKYSACESGYDLNSNHTSCTLHEAESCSGNNWLTHASYEVSSGNLGCVDENNYLLCDDGSTMEDACTGLKTICDPSGTTSSDICVECLTDTHCSGLDDSATHEVGYCHAKECDIKCEAGYAYKGSNCVAVAAKFMDINNDHAYAQINEKSLDTGAVTNPKFLCSTTKTAALSTWTAINATENASCSTCGDNNKEYMADLSSLSAGTYYCTFVFEADGNKRIAEKDTSTWTTLTYSDAFTFDASANVWQYTASGSSTEIEIAVWNFDDSNPTVDSGALTGIDIAIRKGSTTPSLSYAGGNPSTGKAVNATPWSTAETINYSTDGQYYIAGLNLSAYQNIKLQFDGYATQLGKIDVAYQIGTGTPVSIHTYTIDTAKSWKTSAEISLPAAANVDNVTLIFLPYNMAKATPGVRLDNITIVGTPAAG